MKKLLSLLLIIPLFTMAQSDVVILQKNGANAITFTPGMYFKFETIYDQWLEGNITQIKHDSIFINNIPFHYKEIKTIGTVRKKLNYEADGVLLMAAGTGVLVLGSVNGVIRGDNAKSWFTATSYVTAAALLVGGYLLLKARSRKFHLGKKFTLEYFAINPNK